MSGEADWLFWSLAAGAAVWCVLVWWVWRKGRPFAEGDVFRASRIGSRNHLFPTQVLITATSVVQYTPRWLGRQDETIHMAHIASVRIDTGLLFSNVFIETSGGVSPIACQGHTKGDAVRMKNLIERYQTAYYRGQAVPVGAEPDGR